MDGVRGVPSAIANVLPYTEIVLDTGVVVRSDWAAAEVAALADAELLAEAVKTSADDEANAQWNASGELYALSGWFTGRAEALLTEEAAARDAAHDGGAG